MAGGAASAQAEVALGPVRAAENPFRSECVEALPYRAEGFHWDALEVRLEALGGRGAIVGPRGHGKTTLVLEWMKRRKQRGESCLYIRLNEGTRRLEKRDLAQFRHHEHVFIDGAEQLGWLGRRELFHCTCGLHSLVATTHASGLLPTLYRCTTNANLLTELVQELSGNREDGTQLWKRHRGNIREALRELYDRKAGIKISA